MEALSVAMSDSCQHCGRGHAPGTASCPQTGDAMSAPGLLGKQLDRYQVQALLGVGGFGAVYRAKHVHTDAVVALKVLKAQLNADQRMLDRFLREAKAAASVGSDHIVRVLDAGLANGQAFLALEYLDGWDLKELSHREGPLAPQRVAMLVGQVLDGLEAAHARGIVHRDMKPANVFVVGERVKILDFGISKMHGSDGTPSGLTMTGMAMGTPSYMSPEQFFDAKAVDARADLYSVGVMLYELLGGRLPFDADSYAALIVKVKTETPVPLALVRPELPPALAAVVDRALSKEKEHRFASAKDMAIALRDAASGLAGAAPSPMRATPMPAMSPAGLDGGSLLLGKTVTPQPASRPMQQTPAASFGTPVPQAAKPVMAVQPAAKSSNAKWVIIAIVGVLLSCCLMSVLASALSEQNAATGAEEATTE